MAQLLFQGHGSYRITTDEGKVIYVDPFAGEGYDVPASLVIVTHEHPDHDKVDKMPHEQDCQILRAKDFQPVAGDYRTIDAAGIRMTAVQACNENHPIDECVGLVMDVCGVKVYASGDTSTTEDMRSGKLKAMELDYAFLPMDGYYNMDIPEAMECAKLIGAKHVIPCHNFPVHDPNAKIKLLDRERAEAFKAEGRLILEPGQVIELS